MGKKEKKSATPNTPQVQPTIPGQPPELSPSRALVLGRSVDARRREATMSPTPAILAGLGILAFFLTGVALWCLYVPLRSAVQAPAEIVFKNKRQSVQHLEGGIVKRILVKDGDMVHAGQALVELESSQVAPLVDMLEEQNIAEIAYAARVEAESKDLGSIQFPRAVTDRARIPSVARIIQSENKLFAARRNAFQNQVQLLRLQLAEARESSKGTQERLASKKLEIASLKEQLDANQSLQKQGYVTNTVVLDLQRALASYAGERQMLVASIASEKQRMAEIEQRILALKAERVQGAVSEMRQSAMRRIDQQERVRPLRDTLERQIIRAPVTGRVVGLKVATVGGIILPRDPIMEIAPTGDHLILEAKIRLEDVSEVFIGQVADVRITGLDSRQTPNLRAKVTYLSDDRLVAQPSSGQPGYYAGLLDFDQASLKILEKVGIKPGMSAQVAIATKPHSPLDYILAPVREHLRKALTAK